MAPKIIEIRILNYSIRFKASFGLNIDCYLEYFFKANKCVVLLLYFNFNRKVKAFPKIVNYIWLI